MMKRVTRSSLQFLTNDDGPTAVEYAVMLALIIAVCVAAISTIGNNVDETAESVSSAFP
jgi:pilus assembly protein Flp/PilA